MIFFNIWKKKFLHSCYVVMPLGKKKSPEKARSDYVFNTLIKKVCEFCELKAERAETDIWTDTTIARRNMYEKLSTVDIVIAYLGGEKLNENVLIEVGYRLGVDKPILLLRDREAENVKIPFDIEKDKIFHIPDSHIDVNELNRYAEKISEAIKKEMSNQWTIAHPSAEIKLLLGNRIDESYYKYASPKAIELLGFGKNHELIRQKLFDMLDHLSPRMSEADPLTGDITNAQFNMLDAEQKQLINDILASYSNKNEIYVPKATIPIRFTNHPTNPLFDGKSFLPIITHHLLQKDNVLLLKILYLDVTNFTQMEHDENGNTYYACNLWD